MYKFILHHLYILLYTHHPKSGPRSCCLIRKHNKTDTLLPEELPPPAFLSLSIQSLSASSVSWACAFSEIVAMYDSNPTENLFVGRCLFWVSYFLFCCQNSFHLLSSFDWLPVEFQIQSNRWLGRGFRNVPGAKWNPTCHPDVAVSDRPSKLLQFVFYCKTKWCLEVTIASFIITKEKFWPLQLSVEEANMSDTVAQMSLKLIFF